MKKQIKKLVEASYIDEKLDEKTVAAISDKLNRKLLKEYIGLLKYEEKKAIIVVTTAKPLIETEREKIKSLFPKKRIVEQIDPEMIGGIKIVENDEEYEMNLNSTFHDIIRFVSNND
jgi:F0F1-type ATP synthase delta subunit